MPQDHFGESVAVLYDESWRACPTSRCGRRRRPFWVNLQSPRKLMPRERRSGLVAPAASSLYRDPAGDSKGLVDVMAMARQERTEMADFLASLRLE